MPLEPPRSIDTQIGMRTNEGEEEMKRMPNGLAEVLARRLIELKCFDLVCRDDSFDFNIFPVF